MRLGLLRKNTCELGYETCLGLLDLHDLWLTLRDILLCVLDLSLQHPNHTVQLADLIVILPTMSTMRLHTYTSHYNAGPKKSRNTTRHKEKRVFFKSVESCSYFALFDGYIPLTTELVQLFANTFPFLQQGTNKCMINSQNSDYRS